MATWTHNHGGMGMYLVGMHPALGALGGWYALQHPVHEVLVTCNDNVNMTLASC
jgi:hypothetical protein